MTVGRWQMPVSSPVSPLALMRAGRAALRGEDGVLALAAAATSDRFRPRELLLVDSGTSALVLALRLAVGEGGTVAFPGYACVDLAAAAHFAGVRVFNFGRCTPGGGTHRFKQQWGSRDEALWWYQHAAGGAAEASTLSPDDGAFSWGPRLWKKLPMPVATALGPRIVRFIP